MHPSSRCCNVVPKIRNANERGVPIPSSDASNRVFAAIDVQIMRMLLCRATIMHQAPAIDARRNGRASLLGNNNFRSLPDCRVAPRNSTNLELRDFGAFLQEMTLDRKLRLSEDQ